MCVVVSPCWLGSGSSGVFLTDRSSGPSWSVMSSLLRTGFCAVAAAVPPPPAPLLAPPLLQAKIAAALEPGLRAELGVGDGEEEEAADDGGEVGAAGRGPGGEDGARETALGRLWSFMMPLGRGESS